MATAMTMGGGEQALDDKVHDRRWIILGVLCLSLLIIVMDNTILNVAIPSLVRDLDASNAEIQWIIDAYTLVFAGLLLTTGSLSDRFGRKGALQLGIVVFAIGSASAALSTTTVHLIASRAFMGIGGALIMPSTLSILTNVFRDPRERGRAIAVWAGFSGLAVAIGPVTGGLLLKHFSWSSVFWVNIPLGAIALIAGYFLIPTSRDPAQSKLDPLGAVLSIVGLGSLLFGIIEGPDEGWSRPARARRVRRRHHRHDVVHPVGAAQPDADARHALLPEPPLHGGQQRHHADVLRHVRLDVPDDPVLAVRARLQPARRRRAADPLRPDDDGRGADVGPRRRAARHQAGRHVRPARHGHRPRCRCRSSRRRRRTRSPSSCSA